MSPVFVLDNKGRLINMAHVVIIDRDNMAQLTTGVTVQLVDDWKATKTKRVIFS